MIHDIIKKRKSTVLFSSQSIDNEILIELFEAARWAPSSNNLQPWRFIFAIKGDLYYNKFLECMNETNKVWASKAPVLLLTIAQSITDDQKENIYAWHDTGMAYSNLVFQAISSGLSIHPMGGFDKTKARLMAKVPTNYEPVIMAAIGYLSKLLDFDEFLINKEKRERIRRPLKELVFHGSFGTNLSFQEN
jgi:nitroreductase